MLINRFETLLYFRLGRGLGIVTNYCLRVYNRTTTVFLNKFIINTNYNIIYFNILYLLHDCIDYFIFVSVYCYLFHYK